MALSNINVKALLLDIHQDIEEFADFAVTNIFDTKDYKLAYPPDLGLMEIEIAELEKLANNSHLKSALRKIIADSSAGVIFNMLNLFDGTTSPKNDNGDWSGLKLVDEEPIANATPVDDFLHDKFYETYWDWKEIRGDNS